MELKEQFLNIIKERCEAQHHLFADSRYKKRLLEELQDIDDQNEYEYFIDLIKKNAKRPKNENNIFTVKLLGIVDDFDIDQLPASTQGDMPDADLDILRPARDYLKNEWAPKTFGVDNVCSIGSYNTFGIKSSLIDMVRVFDEDRNEILKYTTKLNLKDEDGNVFNWDEALEANPDIANYCKSHPDLSQAAKNLVTRNRGRGKHAAGLIISSIPINNLVPLTVDVDGNPVAAWTEGLAEQDLQPVGLIKMDLLSTTCLEQIRLACNLIEDRHGIESICAIPGLPNWSDDSYLDNEKSLKLANEGDLRGIFQFDSSGIREMVRRGGVTRFEDLVAYSSLYRPGPMSSGMHDSYIDRKKGLEEYSIHPVLDPILSNTYGVLCYQEQIMRILNVVGKIPLKDCEIVRKAISKKKEKIFAKYKVMFMENGQNILGWSEEDMSTFWDQIAAFAGYGFNKSHAVAYSVISARQLWLKAHYPLEFFTASLMCETVSAKIKEYKLDAERHNIKINRIDINKSKTNFSLYEDEIYIGFSKIKGVGKAVGDKIVLGQPYKSFDDFLLKFGHDATVLKALIALGAFKDAGQAELYEYYEFHKKSCESIRGRNKRNHETRVKIAKEFRQMLPPDYLHLGTQEFLNKLEQTPGIVDEFSILTSSIGEVEGLDYAEAWKVVKKYIKNVRSFNFKVLYDRILSISDYQFTGVIPGKNRKVYEEILTKGMLGAEIRFYGFGWEHVLQKMPTFDPFHNFDQFEDEDVLISSVDCVVLAPPIEKVSKKGVRYATVLVEDALWRQESVTFWAEDYDRFSEELNYFDEDGTGNKLKMKVKRPDGGFRNFTFYGPPKHRRKYEVAEDKKDDSRIIVMK